MLQTMMQVSALSRITSYSSSFQPSSERLDEHLMDRADRKTAACDTLELFPGVTHTTAGTAEREGRADHEWQADPPAKARASSQLCQHPAQRDRFVSAEQ
ncbi:MAG: hypothetical protein KatS3mg061_1111 [Dehalococcoidia bacterium]|nr:MAG: hypothetical protein KatS3mg061_1111 [Dehalococcoidia bacterium]